MAGHTDQALACLAEALDTDPTQRIRAAIDPAFYWIRDDPRFQQLTASPAA